MNGECEEEGQSKGWRGENSWEELPGIAGIAGRESGVHFWQ